MRANSLAFRLIASAALWSALALIAAGLILTSLYRQNAESAFDDRLAVYLKTLVGNLAGQSPDHLVDTSNLGEPRFELPYSGWYWQVREVNGGSVVLASRSLFVDVLDMGKATGKRELDGVVSGALVGPDKQFLRVISQTITFSQGHRLDVLVAGNAGDMERQIAGFRNSVIITLAVFGIGLVIATLIQIRWGLRPLDRVRRGLADLRSGKQIRFGENLPAEIEPLVKELNALLASNQEVVDRARIQVGNLAHALKTPLSVIINEAHANRGTPLADKTEEQAELMRSQIGHYLDRARIAAQVDVIGVITDVHPTITRLVRAMNRIHAERDLDITCGGPDAARFRGEQQDLEEIVGNLVDNASKWARSRVSVSTEYDAPHGDAPGRLAIFIDDDGPGLSSEGMEEATTRGKRLDETKPGSGLGLSIVTDLVAMYRGEFSLARSPLGGLRASVILPAA